jgi:hypothetical protein
VALPARGPGGPRNRGSAGGSGVSPRISVVALAAGAAVVAVAILVWSTWQGGDHLVTVDMPAAPPAPAATGARARDPTVAEEEAETPIPAATGDPATGDEDEAEPEPAVAVGDPAFFETPMRVVRRSNIRARPTPGSTALGRADEGAMVILVEPKPDRGYFRVATGELEGWIWGANLVPADPTQQPDPAELSQQIEPDGAEEDPAAPPARP